MDTSTRGRLQGTFDSAARRYAAARPTYPAEAVAWLVSATPVTVLDLAAGSGALTRALLGRGGIVVAAEPSRNLLLELTAEAPRALAVRAAAEGLPFANAAFDVVTVATAFHWFEPERALPEIARVLRAGGRLGLVWNTRQLADPWAREFDALLRAAQPSTLRGEWGTDSVRALDDSSYFEPPEHAGFPHTQRLDRSGLVDLVASRSYVIALDDSTRQDVLAAAAALFDSAADADGYVELSYVADCWRSTSRRR